MASWKKLGKFFYSWGNFLHRPQTRKRLLKKSSGRKPALRQCYDTMPVIRETWDMSKARLWTQHLEQMLPVVIQNTPVFKPMTINYAKYPHKFLKILNNSCQHINLSIRKTSISRSQKISWLKIKPKLLVKKFMCGDCRRAGTFSWGQHCNRHYSVSM